MNKPNYFACTYGNFDGKAEIIADSLSRNVYQLHVGANYPSALDEIEEGDIILLKDGSQIIAHGVATGGVCEDGKDGWKYVVHVDEWKELNPPVAAYGIADNTIRGGQMAAVKMVEPEWATEKLKDCHIKLTCTGPVSVKRVPLVDLLKENIRIPAYQRAYCWRKENIIGLLEGIKCWESGDDIPYYHIGTVILKEKQEEEEKKTTYFDVIDGQQRLLTLAILQACCNKDGTHSTLLDSSIVGSENASPGAIGFLKRAQHTIKEWLEENKSQKNACQKDASQKNPILDKVEFCVVTLSKDASEDLAYFFFNTTNSTGKRLTDYDLLKTHHLRYIDHKQSAEFAATRWNRLTGDGVSELLHAMLYRLRHWSRGRPFNFGDDRSAEHLLFRHFSVKEELLENIYEIPLAPRFDSSLSGGMEFFNYVESYRSKLLIFEQFPGVRRLVEHLAWHSNGVLCTAIKAVTFLFYCKFGEQYLNEALYCIAYRLSELRNESQVRRSHLNHAIFSKAVAALDQSTTVKSFLAWTIAPQAHYSIVGDAGVKKRYWESLGCLLENLQECDGFSIARDIGPITNSFKPFMPKNEGAK